MLRHSGVAWFASLPSSVWHPWCPRRKSAAVGGVKQTSRTGRSPHPSSASMTDAASSLFAQSTLRTCENVTVVLTGRQRDEPMMGRRSVVGVFEEAIVKTTSRYPCWTRCRDFPRWRHGGPFDAVLSASRRPSSWVSRVGSDIAQHSDMKRRWMTDRIGAVRCFSPNRQSKAGYRPFLFAGTPDLGNWIPTERSVSEM